MDHKARLMTGCHFKMGAHGCVCVCERWECVPVCVRGREGGKERVGERDGGDTEIEGGGGASAGAENRKETRKESVNRSGHLPFAV